MKKVICNKCEGRGWVEKVYKRRDSAYQKILAAAIEIVQTRGIRHLTADATVAKAGCSYGLVYHHFGSMDGLRLAALQALATPLTNPAAETHHHRPEVYIFGVPVLETD